MTCSMRRRRKRWRRRKKRRRRRKHKNRETRSNAVTGHHRVVGAGTADLIESQTKGSCHLPSI